MRIVTLLPSATEIVCKLGLKENLMGVSHECDSPTSVQNLPKLTSSSIGKHRSSKEIHLSVEELLKSSISVYDLNLELLASLNPDYIITQDLCDVCAVSFSQVEDACNRVLGPETKIIPLRPQRLHDVCEDVRSVAVELDAVSAYENFKEDLDQRIEHIRKTVATNQPSKNSVLTIEWFDPIMIGGLWVPEMIDIAGGSSLLSKPGTKAFTATRKNLAEINPDVVVIKPCGFKLDQTVQELDTLKANIPWEGWTAYQKNNIFIVDGNAYFNRSGPRILDSLEILSYCLHPEIFPEFFKKYVQALIRLEPGLKIPLD